MRMALQTRLARAFSLFSASPQWFAGAMPWRARPSSPAVASRDLGRQASTQPLAAELDHSMLAVTLALLLFGLVMVYSASIALPDSPRFAAYKSSHFLLRHAFAIAVGLIAAWIAFWT